MHLKLYDYFRSTAAYRVRIALNIKHLAYAKQEVHLVKEGGEQHSAEYAALNPQELVPALQTEEGVITQSLAIIDYLDAKYPEPALYPQSPLAKAYVQSLALSVACDIHPLNNLRVLQYLQNEFSVSDDQKIQWYHHWLQTGFTGIEKRLAQSDFTGKCCYGDKVTVADICLIPQVYNANRFEFSMEEYPRIMAINEYCRSLSVFRQAAP